MASMSSRCRLVLLLSLGALAAAADDAAACAAAGGAGCTKDHAMLQVARPFWRRWWKEDQDQPGPEPGAGHPAETPNPNKETVDMEYQARGCFPRAASDPRTKPANFRDLGCMNATGAEPCHSGLPFFRLALQEGQSYLDCFTFCVSKGMDLFGVMVQEWGSECRCGATPANKAAWKSREPRAGLQLPEEGVPEDDARCAMPVWHYTGGLEDEGLPWNLIEVSGDDLAYLDSIALGRKYEELEPVEAGKAQPPAAAEGEAAQNQTALLSTGGYCEDFGIGAVRPKWICQGIRCSSSTCSGTTGADCCPRSCGLCTGTFIPCTGAQCGPGPAWPKSSDGYAWINYDISYLNAVQKDVFRKAAEAWQQGTCLRFRESSQRPKMLAGTWDANACSSSTVGYPGDGGETRINMGFCGDANSKGLIIHEIGHAIGLNHEHLRPDTTRTKNGHGPYLQVYWGNLAAGWPDQYKEDPSSYVGSTHVGFAPYDFDSVMHYHTQAVSSNGQPVFRTLPNGQYDSVVGHLLHISEGDLKQVNDMYQCGGGGGGSSGGGGSGGGGSGGGSSGGSGCSDDASYRDPGYSARCYEWAGYDCNGYSFSAELKCGCPATCNACGSRGSCGSGGSNPTPAPTPAPTPSPPSGGGSGGGCQDSQSYRDPGYSAKCSEWAGYDCNGYSFSAELKCGCPTTCNACGSRGSCGSGGSGGSGGGCQDSQSYRDPGYNAKCREWAGYECNGYSFSNELKSNCRQSCGVC